MGILKAVFSVLIPGVGIALRRKYVLGAAIFVVWALFVEGYVLVRTVNPAGLTNYVKPSLLAGLLVIFAASAGRELLHLARVHGLHAADQLQELYSEALGAYVSGEDKRADEILRQALKFDKLDVDCLFLRASVAARLGRRSRARRLFRKCRNFDEKGKWGWEVERALETL
jgi:hypothetical protein